MGPRARILAIDEQPYFRSLIEGLLSEQGYRVHCATGLATALPVLERDGPFDLVILDPTGSEGGEAATLGELRERHPGLACIVLTSCAQPERVVASMRAGARDYLLKPLDREHLLRSIEAALQDTPPAGIEPPDPPPASPVALLERVAGLQALGDPSKLGQTLLGLLCSETSAAAGLLWMRASPGGSLQRTAARGNWVLEQVPAQWPAEPALLQRALEMGRPTRHSGTPEEGGELLYLPGIHDGELQAVVRLSEPATGTFSRAAIENGATLARLGAQAITNALERARLEQSSLRDAATGLPTRAFLERVGQTEIHRARRYGRRLVFMCIELSELPAGLGSEPGQAVIDTVLGTLRDSDVVAAQDPQCLCALIPETDVLGSVVLKRRLSERLAKTLADVAPGASASLGVASYPIDGEGVEDLLRIAALRLAEERLSVIHALGISMQSPFDEIGARLLERATPMPPGFVREAAEVAISELTCSPGDQSLLFLAPGRDCDAFLESLEMLKESQISARVFLATHDTARAGSGSGMTTLMLPAEVSEDMTWILRFGEPPAYMLVAGPPGEDGCRPVYHSSDPALVEHLTLRLRAEVGLAVGG